MEFPRGARFTPPTRVVREAMKVADENKIPELEALLSALGIMSWKAEIGGATDRMGEGARPSWRDQPVQVRPR